MLHAGESNHMNGLKAYLLRLTAAAILCSVVQRISTDKKSGQAVRLATGILMLITAFAPVAQIDVYDAVQSVVRNGYATGIVTQDFTTTQNMLYGSLISESARTYILDKANELGLKAEVNVTVKESVGSYPTPYSAEIRASPSASQKASLSSVITDELGIPEERQLWISKSYSDR